MSYQDILNLLKEKFEANYAESNKSQDMFLNEKNIDKSRRNSISTISKNQNSASRKESISSIKQEREIELTKDFKEFINRIEL